MEELLTLLSVLGFTDTEREIEDIGYNYEIVE